MKKAITFLCLIISIPFFSQGAMVVTDLTANQTLASTLTASTKQLTQLEKNYALLKSAEEKYQKINSIVTSVYSLGEIINLQKEAINNVSLVLNKTKLTGKSLSRLENVLKQTLENIAKLTGTISNVLKDGFFNMSDKERIDMFQQNRSAIFFLVSKTRGYANPYRKRN